MISSMFGRDIDILLYNEPKTFRIHFFCYFLTKHLRMMKLLCEHIL